MEVEITQIRRFTEKFMEKFILKRAICSTDLELKDLFRLKKLNSTRTTTIIIIIKIL
jgi:hypothetical protein